MYVLEEKLREKLSHSRRESPGVMFWVVNHLSYESQVYKRNQQKLTDMLITISHFKLEYNMCVWWNDDDA